MDNETPIVGYMADHKSGGLDPRPVVEVSSDGEAIKIQIGSHVTAWLYARNYTYYKPRA